MSMLWLTTPAVTRFFRLLASSVASKLCAAGFDDLFWVWDVRFLIAVCD